ncbi:2923_t:CDS:2, partial [Ambispora leptoticha]
CNAAAEEIMKWKRSDQVAACFRSLFQQNDDGVYWVAVIARTAFSTIAVPDLSNEHCAFTLAVCDILLNPRSRKIVCIVNSMKRHMAKYLDDFNEGGPSYESAEALMDNELEKDGEKSRPTTPSHESETEQTSQASRSNSMQLSQEELDELFAPY